MKSRILTGIIGIPLLAVVILFSDTVVLPIAVLFFCTLGVFEMLGCLGCRKMLAVTIPSLIYSASFAFFTRYIIGISGDMNLFISIFGAVSFAYMFYLMCLAVFSKGKFDISAAAMVAVTVIYIVVGFVSLVILRDMRAENIIDYGNCLFILVFVGAWVPDIAAYFGGRAFGKHKLIPDVSPKKTVEGAVFGGVFGAISFAVTGLIFALCGYGTANYAALALAGLIVAVVSICGDLIASLIKRKFGIKDYGKLFPGHGGVLDRFDSIIAIAPFMLIICSQPQLVTMLG